MPAGPQWNSRATEPAPVENRLRACEFMRSKPLCRQHEFLIFHDVDMLRIGWSLLNASVSVISTESANRNFVDVRTVAPRAGFEPATIRLTVGCSTAELPRNSDTNVRKGAAYNKAFSACIGPNRGFLDHPRKHGKPCSGSTLPPGLNGLVCHFHRPPHDFVLHKPRHSFDAK